MMGVSISATGMQPYFFYSLWQLVKWFFNVCYIQKSVQLLKLLEKKILEKEHSTYLNTLIQDLGEKIFVCAVTLIMRFLYSRKETVSFNVKAGIYRFLKT